MGALHTHTKTQQCVVFVQFGVLARTSYPTQCRSCYQTFSGHFISPLLLLSSGSFTPVVFQSIQLMLAKQIHILYPISDNGRRNHRFKTSDFFSSSSTDDPIRWGFPGNSQQTRILSSPQKRWQLRGNRSKFLAWLFLFKNRITKRKQMDSGLLESGAKKKKNFPSPTTGNSFTGIRVVYVIICYLGHVLFH